MSVGSSASTVATGLVFRLTGWAAAGRKLVEALDSDDPNTQQIAGMYLVQKGEPSRPLLEEAIGRGMTGAVEEVLSDLDADDADLAELRELAQSDNPGVAEAARNLLEKRDQA